MALTLALPFSDGMVLQRLKPLVVWGGAEAGQEVTVSVQGREGTAVADESGQWRVTLEPLVASDAEELVVRTTDEEIVVHDVAVGEVWIAAGQSNMEFWMRFEKHLEEVRPTCANPRIRTIEVPKCSYPNQMGDFDFSHVGIWRKATEHDIERFSAIGYYFAREIEADLGVPVGIVACNYGGSKSLTWMRPDHARVVEPEQTAAFEASLCGLPYDQFVQYAKYNPKNDKGYVTWSAWEEFFLPTTRTDEETRVFMEAEMASVAAAMAGLSMGGDQGQGGPHPGIMAQAKHAPGALFTHMVSRIAGFTSRGVLWYQGESDDEDMGAQARYRRSLETIISDWRQAFDDPVLPFLVVQLPGFGSWFGLEAHDWQTIRQCQQEVADGDEHVWLCSIHDAGDLLDIHPKDKTAAGHRLALLARRYLYGEDVLADALRLASATRDALRLTLVFDNAGEGLSVQGDEIDALVLTDEMGPVSYTFEAEGDRLELVLGRQVQGRLDIAYCQRGFYRANLFNSAGIPAIPFAVTC